jgi:hypothetical protein
LPASPFLEEELCVSLDPSLELRMTEEDDSPSFADVPLSPPQATRAMDKKIASRDCFAALAMTLFMPTITLFIPNFLILNSFQLTKIFYQNIEKNWLATDKFI